jgi:hypothetical protein
MRRTSRCLAQFSPPRLSSRASFLLSIRAESEESPRRPAGLQRGPTHRAQVRQANFQQCHPVSVSRPIGGSSAPRRRRPGTRCPDCQITDCQSVYRDLAVCNLAVCMVYRANAAPLSCHPSAAPRPARDDDPTAGCASHACESTRTVTPPSPIFGTNDALQSSPAEPYCFRRT